LLDKAGKEETQDIYVPRRSAGGEGLVIGETGPRQSAMNDNEVVLLGDDRPNVASVAGKADEAAGNGCEDGNDTEGGVTPAPAQAVELAVDEKEASDTERGTRERESAEVIEERLVSQSKDCNAPFLPISSI